MAEPPQVHEAIAAVIEAMPGIGKDSEITEGGQRYKYRGIEQIKEALKPVLASNGVHYSPHRIRGAVDEPYQTRNGATWQRTRLIVTYRIYGPDGSYIEAEGRGEGADASDKAQNKAMTGAEKQVLLQVFCIADGEDPDAHRGEEQASSERTWTKIEVKFDLAAKILDELKVDQPRSMELAAAAWKSIGDDTRAEWPVSEALELIAACVAEAASLDGMDAAVGGDA